MTTAKTTKQFWTEEQLLVACHAQTAGWERDLAVWINGDGGWLERRCAARLGSVADAEDAMQEITLKVLRSIGQFEGRSALRTWVTRIADNHCSSFMRLRAATSMTAHLQHSIAVLEHERFDRASDDVEHGVAVRQTLNALADKNREILQLRFFSELSLAEIASSLELSLSATKMRLYRAMDAFKQKHSIENN